ncbi:MAG: DUF1294 domain-containing protein [Bacteroidales bacterium]|nr:DUF1294 domain-containing protein [Bacteroidales bacterium]
MNQAIAIALLAVNIVTFTAYGIDKWKAKRHRWRIPESTLILMAAIGGSIGAYVGMQVFHHKTQHRKFTWGVPAIMAAQLAAVAFVEFGL